MCGESHENGELHPAKNQLVICEADSLPHLVRAFFLAFRATASNEVICVLAWPLPETTMNGYCYYVTAS